MFFRSPQYAFTAATAPGTFIEHDPDYKLTDVRRTEVNVETYSPEEASYSVSVFQSNDGVRWHIIGVQITTDGLNTLVVTLPYLMVTVDSVNGGTVNVILS